MDLDLSVQNITITVALCINAFFLRQLLFNLARVDKALAVLIEKHGNIEKNVTSLEALCENLKSDYTKLNTDNIIQQHEVRRIAEATKKE